jgi:hypothetical protein
MRFGAIWLALVRRGMPNFLSSTHVSRVHLKAYESPDQANVVEFCIERIILSGDLPLLLTYP